VDHEASGAYRGAWGPLKKCALKLIGNFQVALAA